MSTPSRAVEAADTTMQTAQPAEAKHEQATDEAEPQDELKCTFCGLRACWTERG